MQSILRSPYFGKLPMSHSLNSEYAPEKSTPSFDIL